MKSIASGATRKCACRPNIDYADVGGLSNEARQCLRDVRPETLGQAARIPGLTPAAVSLLLVHLEGDAIGAA